MARVLIVAEHDGEHLNLSTAKCVSCAVSFENDGIAVVVLAADGQSVAGEAAALEGVRTVLRIDHPANETSPAATWAPQSAAVAAN